MKLNIFYSAIFLMQTIVWLPYNFYACGMFSNQKLKYDNGD